MSGRRRFELVALAVATATAGLAVLTVPATALAPWAAGTLGPLVLLGAVVCTRSWPWSQGEIAADEPRDPSAPAWRLIYLAPLTTTAVCVPALVRQRPEGFGPAFSVALVGFLAYLALLLGAVVFLVLVLPVGLLIGSLQARREGRSVSPYVPLGALVILGVTGLATGGALGLTGLPDDLAVPYLVVAVVGILLPGVRVVSPAWLLVARLSALLLAAAAVGLVVAGNGWGASATTLRLPP